MTPPAYGDPLSQVTTGQMSYNCIKYLNEIPSSDVDRHAQYCFSPVTCLYINFSGKNIHVLK